MNLEKIKVKINNLFKKNLVRDTLWVLFAKLFKVVMQAAYFIIVARVLGAKNYGSFIGVTALASIIFPFAALGSEHILVKNVAINRSLFRTYWGNSLIVLLSNSILLIVVLLLLSPLIFADNISPLTIFIILIADLLCLALLDLSFKALISVGLVKKSAQLGILNTCIKLIAAISLATFFPGANISVWAVLYLIALASMAIISILIVNKLAGYPQPLLSKIKSNIKQGIYFSISTSASNINASLDKTMLASISTLEATGIYGSAYRFIDVGNVILLAVFTASYTKFFQHGAAGIGSSLNFAKKFLPFMLIYGIVTVVGYLVFAPFLPYILGEEYVEAINALRWLAPLPCIAAFQFLAADTLTGAGFQKTRSIIQVGAALLNIGLNIWLIPIYSWQGAAWATLIADSLRVMCLWLSIAFLYRRELQNQQ